MRIDFMNGVLTLSLEEGETSFKVIQDEGIMRISPNSERDEQRKKEYPKSPPIENKKVSVRNLRTASQVVDDEFGDDEWTEEDETNLLYTLKEETLRFLREAQTIAPFHHTKGIARCKRCGTKILPSPGYYAYEGWEWPSDLEHTIAKHDLFPSEDFLDFLEGFRPKHKRAKSAGSRKK